MAVFSMVYKKYILMSIWVISIFIFSIQSYCKFITLVDFGLFDFWTFFEDFFNTKKIKKRILLRFFGLFNLWNLIQYFEWCTFKYIFIQNFFTEISKEDWIIFTQKINWKSYILNAWTFFLDFLRSSWTWWF